MFYMVRRNILPKKAVAKIAVGLPAPHFLLSQENRPVTQAQV
jgi:hypothetical protein